MSLKQLSSVSFLKRTTPPYGSHFHLLLIANSADRRVIAFLYVRPRAARCAANSRVGGASSHAPQSMHLPSL